MHFAEFQLPNSKETVYINGSLVRTVRAVSPKNNKETILTFDVEHAITVAGSSEDALKKLEMASVDLSQRGR